MRTNIFRTKIKHKSAKHKGHNVQDNIHSGIKCTRNILYTWDVFRPDQSILAPMPLCYLRNDRINAFSLPSVSDADIAAAEARVKQARQRLAHAIKVTCFHLFYLSSEHGFHNFFSKYLSFCKVCMTF
jgi:hypothetical protein